MMLYLAWLFCLGSIPVAAKTESLSVVFLGDSLTAGYGLHPEQSYPELLRKYFGVNDVSIRPINAGVSGDTTQQGLTRLKWILKQNPQVIVIALGANDMLRGMAPKATEENLLTLITQIKSQGIKPILFGMKALPNLGQKYGVQFEQIYTRVAQKTQTPLLPFFIRSVAGKPEYNQADGIHPNEKGHEKIAEDISVFLRNELRKIANSL